MIVCVPATPLDSYKRLQAKFWADPKSSATRALLTECVIHSIKFLSGAPRVKLGTPERKRRKGSQDAEPTLVEEVPIVGKSYFAFSRSNKLSRAINNDLFHPDVKEWKAFLAWLDAGDFTPNNEFSSERLTSLIYGVAISFCACVDLLKSGDQQTPGTFFAYLISHLFASRVGVNPDTSLPLINAEADSRLPTDFIFTVTRKRRFHLGLKTSTRERAIQVFAHQAMLDNIHGKGVYMGTPVILAETKASKPKREVVEICLPKQWMIYQRYLAHLTRVYYLDVPKAYAALNEADVEVAVKPFGDFFFEADLLKP